MVDVSKLTIDGFPCRLTKPLVWSLYTGSNPRITTFPMVPEDAQRLLSKGKREVTIVMEGRGGKRVEIKKLTLIGEGQPSNPFERVVEISDRRYDWSRVAVGRTFNDVINSLSVRAVSPDGTPLPVAQYREDLTFAKYSIKDDDTGYTAREVLEATLKRVVGEEGTDWEIRANNFVERKGAQGLIQNLDLENNGSTAMSIAMALNNGINCFQDLSGKIIIDSQLPGRADSLILSLGDVSDGGRLVIGLEQNGPCLRKIDRSLDRAKEVEVLFTREIGVRADAKENATFTDEDLWARNVAQTTDPTTTLNDGTVVGPGTTAPFLELIAIWSALLQNDPTVGPLIQKKPLTLENIRKYFLINLYNIYVRGSVEGYDANDVIARYITEINRSFRKVYQINPRYAHAAKAIVAKTPGFVDPETGTEGRAQIYSDYAIKPSQLAIARSRNDNQQNLVVNHRGAADPINQGGGDSLLANAKRSPFDLRVVSRAGVLEFLPRRDPWGNDSQVVPSLIDEDTIPTADPFAAIGTFNKAELEDEHRANMVFTMVPGPRDETVYHKIVVSPSQAQARLKLTIGETKGPKQQEFVGYQVQPAKFAYRDSLTEEIKKAFGIIDGEPDLGEPLNKEVIEELALVIAASYYEQKLDRWSGTIVVPLRGNVEPIGEIQIVSFILTPQGDMFTTVACGIDENERLDPLAQLSQSARREILRQVNPTGA